MDTPTPPKPVELDHLRPTDEELRNELWRAQSTAASLRAAMSTFAELVVGRDPLGMEMAAAVHSGEAAFPDIPVGATRGWYAALVARGARQALGDAQNYVVVELDDCFVTVQRRGRRTPLDHLLALSTAAETAGRDLLHVTLIDEVRLALGAAEGESVIAAAIRVREAADKAPPVETDWTAPDESTPPAP